MLSYQSAIPVLQHYLNNMLELIQQAENAIATGLHTEQALLSARLSPDMFGLADQLCIACGFCLRACYPLAGLDIPEIPPSPLHLQGLRQRVAATQALLAALPDSLATPPTQVVTQAGLAEHTLPSAVYLAHYALPNFFFHLSMAYAILRQAGIPVSKGHFDGFHHYPTGFQFHDQ
ncbi:hypothetical protein HNQ59_002744 [Chitinivorax tropicus]|uniref:DUF1993 domain-containing protein n=1 Tax=Chitinivorax tropicus TaxID=714531 RepID=A0A840MRN4_9PROT|nr:DUF1993 family protein [Chitinivorax tropicus]MBB5019442.1 hypothetical protein [Chitinivorax tropicus]